MNKITRKLLENKNYKLTEEEKTQVDLLDKSLTSNNRFQLYKQIYNKNYSTKTEEIIANNNLKKSLIVINKVNSSGVPYKLGFTTFSDLSNDEFYNTYVGKLSDQEMTSTTSKDILQDDDITKSSDDVKSYLIDWSDKKHDKVSPIQQQLGCGSCWAFSSVATFESKIAIDKNLSLSKKNIPKLSEQQLVSCSKNSSPGYGKGSSNNGCSGGLPVNAFYWYKTNNAALEKDYKYTSGQTKATGKCDKSVSTKKTMKVKDFKKLTSEAEMASYLHKNGPLSIAIAVGNFGGGSPLQYYKGGIYTGKCGTHAAANKPDHAVVIVGLVKATDISPKIKDKKIQYAWKIRNSWGAGWGDKGYIYFPYGQNKCLIKSNAMAITSINVDIPKGDAKTPTPGPSKSSTPSPTPKSTPKPTLKPSPKPTPNPSPIPGPNPISNKNYQKYYTNPNNGSCPFGRKMDFKNNGVEYSVCTTEAVPPPSSAGFSSLIKLAEYCPGMEVKGNIAPIFFLQDSEDKKYCGVACNSNSDCFNGATCQLINPQSQLQVCAFRR